jgi:hypothetical protein
MPLKRLREEYLEQDGVHFLMEDDAGSTVTCRVSHEALRDHADCMLFRYRRRCFRRIPRANRGGCRRGARR